LRYSKNEGGYLDSGNSFEESIVESEGRNDKNVAHADKFYGSNSKVEAVSIPKSAYFQNREDIVEATR